MALIGGLLLTVRHMGAGAAVREALRRLLGVPYAYSGIPARGAGTFRVPRLLAGRGWGLRVEGCHVYARGGPAPLRSGRGGERHGAEGQRRESIFARKYSVLRLLEGGLFPLAAEGEGVTLRIGPVATGDDVLRARAPAARPFLPGAVEAAAREGVKPVNIQDIAGPRPRP
jgi:hypothetical protein